MRLEGLRAFARKRLPPDLVAAIRRQGMRLNLGNAGVGSATPLITSDVEKMSDMIHLNVGALTRLTSAAAPRFVARGQGTIINIASTAGLRIRRTATDAER